MSRKELILLASRALALLLACWAMVELTYLPQRILELSQHLSQRSVLATYGYLSSYYLFLLLSNVLRMLAMFAAAVAFWKCGPRVEALFTSRQSDDQED